MFGIDQLGFEQPVKHLKNFEFFPLVVLRGAEQAFELFEDQYQAIARTDQLGVQGVW